MNVDVLARITQLEAEIRTLRDELAAQAEDSV
jgi:cell division protein FtsB